jgi:outer membrane lipoprotein LolB
MMVAGPCVASRRRDRRAAMLALTASLLVSACATPDLNEPGKARDRLIEPSQWSGRFSAVYTLAGTTADEQSAAGRFRLSHRDGQTLLELSSPTGQTIARAHVDGEGARLTDSQGQQYRATSAEALTERLFGWRIPVLALPQWLQGRIQGPASLEAGRIRTASESGWRIKIDSWLDNGLVRTLELSWPEDGVAAPRRMRLRLVVDTVS